jgi:N-acetylmuramoyl-L-alanine amidase
MSIFEGILWLTLNVYHEARSEPQIGQVAVAQVTLNRADVLGLSIKEVVQQPYQFSWTHQKKSYIPENPKAFFQCMHSVYVALRSPDFTTGATFYHHEGINPFWTAEFDYINTFGSHRFYRK